MTAADVRIPRKGDLYALNRPNSVGFLPRPAAAVADGLFRMRQPSWRDPRHFVDASARAGNGETVELFVPLLHTPFGSDEQHVRSGVERDASRMAELAGGFDMSMLASAAARWGHGPSLGLGSAKERSASVYVGGEPMHVSFVRFDSSLAPWSLSLLAYDERAEKLRRDRIESERARAARAADLETLQQFARDRGLKPKRDHIQDYSDRPGGIVALSPKLVDTLIAEARP